MAQLVWKETAMNSGPPIPTSLTPAETEKLRQLAAGQHVLEIGSAYGYSAIQMVLGGARHVLAIDPHMGELPDSLPVMLTNLEVHGVADRVSIILSTSQRALPPLVATGARFGLVWIDGNHDIAVESDVAHGFELLAPGGHMAVHDYGEDTFPEIIRVCDAAIPEPPELVDTLWVASRNAF